MEGVSYVSSYFHCVFSTKERRPLITPALRDRLWPFMGGIARQNKMKAIEIGGSRTTFMSSFRCRQRSRFPRRFN